MNLSGKLRRISIPHLSGWQMKLMLVGLVFLTPAVWIGCSIAEDYEALSFWFDGVPTVEQLEARRLDKLRAKEIKALGPLTSEERLALSGSRVNAVFISTHKPVEEKKCGECHVITPASSASQSGWASQLPELVVPPVELCLRCHEPPKGTFTHGPAASGACSICHLSHTSPYPHLMRRKRAEDLCKHCHDPLELMEQTMHAENASFDCIACHNPHASEHEYLLHSDYPRVPEEAD